MKDVNEQFVVDPKQASQEEIAEAFKLLAKKKERDHKIATGQIKGSSGRPWSELTDEQKEKSREYNRKRQVRLQLLANKAIAQGILVTDEEVELAILEKQEGVVTE